MTGTAKPAPVQRILDANEDTVLAEIHAQLGQLTDRILLLRLAVYRRGGLELTEARLERLAQSLWHAAEDTRAAQRSWRSGR
jgi:hypothetical protein